MTNEACDGFIEQLPSLQRRACVDLPPSDTPLSPDFPHENDSLPDEDPDMAMDCDDDDRPVPQYSGNHIDGMVDVNPAGRVVRELDDIAGHYSPLASPNLMALPSAFPGSSLAEPPISALEMDIGDLADLSSNPELLLEAPRPGEPLPGES